MSKNGENTMRKVFLYMTMTFDGFFSGPNGELDWMSQTPDQELNDDIVALLKSADAGLMGFPTASLMIPYWVDAAKNPSTSKGELAIGNGKGVFTNRVNLELVSAKTYTSGVMRVCYRPR